jgi:hypothetical protein
MSDLTPAQRAEIIAHWQEATTWVHAMRGKVLALQATSPRADLTPLVEDEAARHDSTLDRVSPFASVRRSRDKARQRAGQAAS